MSNGSQPSPPAISTSPADWLVQFITPPSNLNSDQQQAMQGLPWADGTDMASRYPSPEPWDQGCTVQPYIGSLAATSAIAADLEKVISAAANNPGPPGQNGYVFIADWRFNCLRDLGGGPSYQAWSSPPGTLSEGVTDQTAIGFVLRLMQAGVQVWLMLWYPTSFQNRFPSLHAHVADHRYACALVGAENSRLQNGSSDIFGAVALDCRVADNGLAAAAAAHHQKFLIIRSGGINRAYMGGVDLAFTRRDAPVGSGDWQSAGNMPLIKNGWPRQAAGVDYMTAGSLALVADQTDNPGSDLPMIDSPNSDGNQPVIYGTGNQLWHDRHLCLEGPIVQTLDSHFRERWNDYADTVALSFYSYEGSITSISVQDSNWQKGCVIVSSPELLMSNPLPAQPHTTSSTVPMVSPPAGQPSVSSGQSIVQMWRTVPLRKSRIGKQNYFQRGEFTIIDGLVNAVLQSSQLIWIFDQYFWSQPFARLLNYQLAAQSSLYIIVVLPPHADGEDPDDSIARAQHYARYLALSQLVQQFPNRVGVYSMWQNPPTEGSGRGIYVHAKSHIYDGTLLVTGSANMNRRSLTGDSELMCAVLDQQLALSQMQALWTSLFPSRPATGPTTITGYTPPFPISLAAPDWGGSFFASFQQAATLASLVYLDTPPPTAVSATLPSGALRNLPGDEAAYTGANKPGWYDWTLESSSVNYQGLEGNYADLASVMAGLNSCDAPSGTLTFPFRPTGDAP
jgi:PLD-like domain